MSTHQATSPAGTRWVLPVLSVVLAVLLVAAGLVYGVEELAWDPAHQTYAYQARPHGTAVLWSAITAALAAVLWGCRTHSTHRTDPAPGPTTTP